MVEELRPAAAAENPGHDGRSRNPEVRHERSDVSFRWIMGVLIGAAGLGVIIHFAVGWFFDDYRDYQARIKRSPFPLAPAPSDALPPAPRLEQLDRLAGVERSNVFEREASRERILNSFGPAAEEGFVHIPIDRAMALLANKLPARKAPAAGQGKREDGLVDSGASNSGRMFRGKPRWYEH